MWFAIMAGIIFCMVSIVDVVRGNRGSTQIEEAFGLLDRGNLSEGIQKLEAAEVTFTRIGESFPQRDTLFGLYLRMREYDKAQLKLDQMYRGSNSPKWTESSLRLIRATIEDDFSRALYVTQDLVDHDLYLRKYNYPADLDSIFGLALAEKMVSNGYAEGFYRQHEWSDQQIEWWYYVAENGEKIEPKNFYNLAAKAFGGKKKVYIDLFEMVPGMEIHRDHIGYTGRVILEGDKLKDSILLAPESVAHDSLDTHSRWAWYVDEYQWDMLLFTWNTVLMSAPVQEPYYQNQFYLRLRERTNWFNREALLDIARMRDLQQQQSDHENCIDGDEVDCWSLQIDWLEPLPLEYAEIWAEKFPYSPNSLKAKAAQEHPRTRSLSSSLTEYVTERRINRPDA